MLRPKNGLAMTLTIPSVTGQSTLLNRSWPVLAKFPNIRRVDTGEFQFRGELILRVSISLKRAGQLETRNGFEFLIPLKSLQKNWAKTYSWVSGKFEVMTKKSLFYSSPGTRLRIEMAGGTC